MRRIFLIINQLQRFSLYLFLFSVNYEIWDPLNTGGNFSVSKLTGLIYFCTIIPHVAYFCRQDRIRSVSLPVLLFFLLLTSVNLFNVNYLAYNFFDLTIFQNSFLLLFLINHARKEPLVLEIGLLSFALGSMSLALLYNAGIGIEYAGGRVSLFGDNENAVGLRMCISMTILILAVVQNRLELGMSRYLFLLPIPIMLQLMFQTGSRVAVSAFCIIFITGIVLLKTKNMRVKIVALVVGAIAFIYGWTLMMKSETLLLRFLKTSEEGDLTGRDIIWQKLLPLIENDPIFGVGKTGYVYFTQTAFGGGKSPHNVFLEVLCYTGIVGFVIYLVLLYRIFTNSYQSYKTNKLLLPVLLLIPVSGLLISGQALGVKISWVIFAYVISCSMFYAKKENNVS